MIMTTKINTHFTNLIKDEVLASAYFSRQSFDEYNHEKLNELKRNVDSSNKKCQITSLLLSVAIFSNIQSLTSKISLMLEKEQKKHFIYKSQLEIFESNLAYLVLSGKIKPTEELGFSSDYIEKLVNAKQKELESSTIEYYYDEKSGGSSQIINDKAIIRPYTPNAVRERICGNQRKKRM